MLLGPVDERVLERKEVAGTTAIGVGPVEALHIGPVCKRRRLASGRPSVHVVAAPGVPALPGEDAVLDYVGGVARGVPYRQRHPALSTWVSDELEQVVALDELWANRDGHGRVPVVAGHHPRSRREGTGRLHDAVHFR